MDAEEERKIIRLWNRLRLLEREGRTTAVVRRQIEKALGVIAVERDRMEVVFHRLIDRAVDHVPTDACPLQVAIGNKVLLRLRISICVAPAQRLSDHVANQPHDPSR